MTRTFQPDLRTSVFFKTLAHYILQCMRQEHHKNAAWRLECLAWPLKMCVLRHPILLYMFTSALKCVIHQINHQKWGYTLCMQHMGSAASTASTFFTFKYGTICYSSSNDHVYSFNKIKLLMSNALTMNWSWLIIYHTKMRFSQMQMHVNTQPQTSLQLAYANLLWQFLWR